MDTFRMVRIGNRTVNLTQITFAEYTPAFTPPPIDPATALNPNHHPISYTRPEPRPSSLVVHFVGGEQQLFQGEFADELHQHFDLLV